MILLDKERCGGRKIQLALCFGITLYVFYYGNLDAKKHSRKYYVMFAVAICVLIGAFGGLKIMRREQMHLIFGRTFYTCTKAREADLKSRCASLETQLFKKNFWAHGDIVCSTSVPSRVMVSLSGNLIFFGPNVSLGCSFTESDTSRPSACKCIWHN